ncbi:YbcC family protein [Erythrobacter sp. YT30]|uniref:YbcC family protein n=1 Tax=Erythrobacter sp. YT30 TaxID=1735012 RepID=UPI0018D20DA7|nr:DUF2309 domain-containing protein [Erythrobacter sp. YT30]
MKHSQIAPSRMSEILTAAEKAARAIPPAFPLDATVAVNPFLGQTGEDLATASARLARVSGTPITQSASTYDTMIEEGRITEDDLADALEASTVATKPKSVSMLKLAANALDYIPEDEALPTIADLAAEASGTDWPSVIDKTFGIWAAGQFDRGQALWSPAPGEEAYAAWRAFAVHDLTPEIAGLSGFCAAVAAAPDTPERAIVAASDALGLTDKAAETAFHRLYISLGGWSQHARWLLWQAELAEESDQTLAAMLAIRLIWEEQLLALYPEIEGKWKMTVEAHAEPIAPSRDQAALAVLQDAADRSHQRTLLEALTGKSETDGRALLQAAFCIDVRSEVFRRALESVDGGIETIGFAGFFGLPLAHKSHGSDIVENRLPVLLNPAVETTSEGDPETDFDTRIAARTTRAWGRFRQAAVSSFAFVEAMGPLYAVKLLKSSLGLTKSSNNDPAPKVVGGMSFPAKVDTAETILKAMSMTKDFGKIILLLGHGGNVTNNPHESAYHCGACGGHQGDVSARVLADLLNDPETRQGLETRGLYVPDDTLFVAGLHDTTTDKITLFDAESPERFDADLEQVHQWLHEASAIARAERAPKLPGSHWTDVELRARNWAEIRPEWGLAGCAAFIAAPRSATAGKDLGGRAFLHSYDWQADSGFTTLELIMTAPVVVASWISLQYYGSSVAPDIFGGGNKLIHNVVGGIGVIEGNSGRLRPGLPWQSVHDGDKLMHDPVRLSVMIEAPREEISKVLEAHPHVRDLFDNGWLHLFALADGKVNARYRPGEGWQDEGRGLLAA